MPGRPCKNKSKKIKPSKPCNKFRASKLRPRCKTVSGKKPCNKFRKSKLRPRCKTPSRKKRRRYQTRTPPLMRVGASRADINIPDDVVRVLKSSNSFESVTSSIDDLVPKLLSVHLDLYMVHQLLNRFIRNDPTLKYDVHTTNIVDTWKLYVEEAEKSTKLKNRDTNLNTDIVNKIADLCMARFVFDDLSNQESELDAIEFAKEDSHTVNSILNTKIIGKKQIDVEEILHVLAIF